MDLPLTTAGVTVTVTPTINLLTGIITVSVPAMALPAGRTFRTVTVISGTPTDVMPMSVSSQVDGQTPPASVSTYRFHLPLDGVGEINVLVVVQEQVNGIWIDYDFVTWQQAVAQAPGVLASAARPLVGINAHVFIPQHRIAGSLTPMLNKLIGSNVTLVRASAPWSYMAPTSAAFDAGAQAQCDAFADWLRANACKWVVSLPATPAAWGAIGGTLYSPPNNWADYDVFLDAFLARYGDVIAIVENINEPNGSAPLIGSYNWTWPLMLASQQHLYNRTKAYNPAILVTGPAIAWGDAAYTDTMYVQGLGPYMDLMNIHPYDLRFDRVGTSGLNGNSNGITIDPIVGWNDEAGKSRDLLHGIQAVYEVMQAHGDGSKKILVGEWGIATSFTGQNKKQSTLDASLDQQKNEIVTAVRQVMRDSRVYGFLLYMLYDNAADSNAITPFDITNWQHNFGVTSPYGSVDKPSLAAFKTAIANPT